MLTPNIADSSNVRSNSKNAGSDDIKKWKAAQDFEAIFIHQMLKSMRNTVPKSEDESSGRRIFSEMLDEQIANSASKTGSFGLAKIIYKELAGANAEIPNVGGYNAPLRASAKQINNWVNEAAETFSLDENLLKAVIKQESDGNSLARSPKGAKGLMQLMDSTAKDMGVNNVWSGRQNVMGGARYLKQLLGMFEGDETKALAAYNAGPGKVMQYGGIPPYEETENYVKNVLSFKEQFSKGRNL